MHESASYLPRVSDAVREPPDFVPELSRRARGFATWAVIRTLGREGIAEIIERQCRLARRFAERCAGAPGIELVNDVTLNQVVLRFGPGEAPERRDALTLATIDRIREDGVCLLGGARWHDAWVLRFSISGLATDEREIDGSADAVIGAWNAVRDA